MTYKKLDMALYPRRDHFEYFLAMENPMVSLTVHVDITKWFQRLKKLGYPFFLCFQYAAVQAANAVPAFRQRIKDGGIIEYDFCNPSYTVSLPDGTYRYCLVNANQPLKAYLEEAQRKQEEALHTEHLEEEGDPLGLLFTTCVPWFSFTDISMPWPDRSFSNPNIGWGKYTKDTRLSLKDGKISEEEVITIPVTVMVNHALVDGIHLSRFLEQLDRQLDQMFLLIPTREESERLLKEAEKCNPGPWGNHSRITAHCAQKIAEACEGMDPERAYILGLLHDIGRKFGVRHLGHVSDGYSYMKSLGYDDAARICLTHSFNNMTTDEYIGKFDVTDEELNLIRTELAKVIPDDYDRLIQLCDALAGSEGIMNIEERMSDVKRRYGMYPQAKWDANIRLRSYFEQKAHKDIYELVEKDTYFPAASNSAG